MILALYCKCGGYWKGQLPYEAAMAVKLEFERIHRGPGHGRTDPETCRRARAKAEREMTHA